MITLKMNAQNDNFLLSMIIFFTALCSKIYPFRMKNRSLEA